MSFEIKRTCHRFPPIPGGKRNVIIRVVEYNNTFLGRWESRRECIYGNVEIEPECAAASAYTALLEARGIDLETMEPRKRKQ